MAVLKSIANGNFSSASTWGVVDSLSFLDTRANTVSTVSTTSQTFSCNTSTVLGILLQLSYATSPPSGTIRTDLLNAGTSAVLGSTIINASDLPLSNNVGQLGWVYFPFSGAAVSVVAGTGYQIRLTSTNAVVLYFLTTTNNISRGLLTNTTQAAATNDILIINGGYSAISGNYPITVTMDSTATTNTYSTIYVDTRGKLSYGLSGNTNYFLRTNGSIFLRGKGELEIGNSVTRVPSTSSAILELSATSINTVGITIQGGTLTGYGNPITTRAKLANTLPLNSVTVTANTTTNWKNGDLIGIPSTTRTNTNTDFLPLTANSVGNILNVPPITVAHDSSIEGMYTTDIAHFTRNLKINGNNSTAPCYISVGGYNSTINLDYVEMTNIGGNNTSLYTGYLLISNTTSGSTSITNSAFWYTGATALNHVYISSQSTAPYHSIIYSNNNVYNLTNGYVDIAVGATGIYSATTVANNIFIRTPVDQRRINVVFSGNVMTSCAGTGLALNPITTGNPSYVINNTNLNNNIIHSNNGVGLNMGFFSPDRDITITNLLCFRNNGGGIIFNSPIYSVPVSTNIGIPRIIFLSGITFGNTTAGVYTQGIFTSPALFQDCYLFLGTTFTQSYGFFSSGAAVSGMDFYNCKFGLRPYGQPASALVFNVGLSSNYGAKINAYNCFFSGGTLPTTNTNFSYEPNSFASMNHNNVSGDHRMYQYGGTITLDTVIFSATSPSIRMTPAVSTAKTYTVPQKVPVSSGATCTVSVLVRKSVVSDGTAYNGSQPRLIVKKNYLGGIMSDTLLTTGTTANGIWETLQGTTPRVIADCVLEFYVDCDGTTGWINVDKWSSTTNNDTREMRYWIEGSPYVEIDYSTSSGSGGEKSFVFVG